MRVDGHTVRGVGMAISMQGSGIANIDTCSAVIRLNDNGFYTLMIGATDMGTGCDTILAQMAAEVADIVQIPAFLCRQTDLLIAAANTGKCVNVKKAQFLAPWDMKNVVHKLEESGNRNIMLCERGTSFGYNTLVVDMTSIVEMKKNRYPVIFDGTHSVQKPGGNGSSTSGNREYVSYLVKAAVAAGADGVFLETHLNPEEALSDGANMIRVDDVKALLETCLKIRECV